MGRHRRVSLTSPLLIGRRRRPYDTCEENEL